VPTNPAVRKAVADLVESLADLSDDSLETLTAAARDTVPGAEFASITVVNEDGTVETLAPTDPIIAIVDQIQAELKEGPCYDAATEDAVYVAEDLAHDERWPNYGPKAVAHGIGSQMGVDLHHPGKARAALNLYSKSTWHFVDAVETAELFASHASLVLGYATANDHFQLALSSRKTIGQALGIVMERYGIDEDRAFQFLIRVSQDSNVKVREVAADIVAGVNRRNQKPPSTDG
jgi:GAF domain-containing protein